MSHNLVRIKCKSISFCFLEDSYGDSMGNVKSSELRLIKEGLVGKGLRANRRIVERLANDGDESDADYDDGGSLAVEEDKPKLKRPPLYQVVLLNDDYTPMEFVIEILEGFFSMGREQATQVMLMVHTKGKGVCGVYSRDVAETKAAQVNQYAKQNEHPLLCEIEASDDDGSDL